MSKEYLQRHFSLLIVSVLLQEGGDKETMCTYRQHFQVERGNSQGTPPQSCFLQVSTEQPHIRAALKSFIAPVLAFIFNTQKYDTLLAANKNKSQHIIL